MLKNKSGLPESCHCSRFCWRRQVLLCACVCLWVNICVKCEAKQASQHATWNVLSKGLKGGSAVFGSCLKRAKSSSFGGQAEKSHKDKESVGGWGCWGAGELESLHQHELPVGLCGINDTQTQQRANKLNFCCISYYHKQPEMLPCAWW